MVSKYADNVNVDGLTEVHENCLAHATAIREDAAITTLAFFSETKTRGPTEPFGCRRSPLM